MLTTTQTEQKFKPRVVRLGDRDIESIQETQGLRLLSFVSPKLNSIKIVKPEIVDSAKDCRSAKTATMISGLNSTLLP